MAPHTEAVASLRSVYEQQCDSLQCKKNSNLVKYLSGLDFAALTELDLNLNFVGRIGVRAVLGVAKAAPNLWKLCLSDNFLTNDSVKEIVRVLNGHPGLQYLDLSRNPISHVAAKALSSFISDNPKVHTVILSDTLITPAMLRTIQGKLEGRAAISVSTCAVAASVAAPPETPVETQSTSPKPVPEPKLVPESVATSEAAPEPQDREATPPAVVEHSNVVPVNVANETPPKLPTGPTTSADRLKLVFDIVGEESWENFSSLQALHQAVESERTENWEAMTLIWDVAVGQRARTLGLASIMALIRKDPKFIKEIRDRL
eukprot:TRINITY_DN4569_c0_g1_i1.p1 TRINITY_DN4569_c0_g1~~TRINITY_DN4569_c0_g1_i1.p1  ORF type:complete len:317 (+),score=48.06 TRINITY_DN4569_c0_g1_i1:45-995(+)